MATGALVMAVKLSESSLATLIEDICRGGRGGELHVALPDGPAVLYFKGGELVHAEAAGGLSGSAAVSHALATAAESDAELKEVEAVPARTIHEPWPRLVLEASCRVRKDAPDHRDGTEKDAGSDVRSPWLETAFGRQTFGRSLFSPGGFRSALFHLLQIVEAQRLVVVGISSASLVFAVLLVSLGGPSPSEREESVAPPLPPLPTQVFRPTNTRTIRPVTATEPGETAEPARPPETGSGRNLPGGDAGRRTEAATTRSGTRATTTARVNATGGETEPETRPPSSEARERRPEKTAESPASSKEGGDVKTIVVSLQLEGGRVVTASVVNRQPGFESYEATALRAARAMRYPADRNGTESVAIKVRAPK